MKYFLLILQHFLYVIMVHFWLNQYQKGAKVASLCCVQHQTDTIHCSIVYCNQIFIHQVVLGRRQRREEGEGEEEEEMRRGNDCNKGYCFSFRVELPAPVYLPHTIERQMGKLWILSNFCYLGLTWQGIEPESTVSLADALSTQPLIDWHRLDSRILAG